MQSDTAVNLDDQTPDSGGEFTSDHEPVEGLRILPATAGPTRFTGGIYLSDVVPEFLDWLSYGRLAADKITEVLGDPGLGKITLVGQWAADITQGKALPDGTANGTPRGVVLLAGEESLEDTVRPRLEAAGADLELVLALTEPPGGGIYTIPNHLAKIEEAISTVNAALLIIDPFVAYLDPNLSANHDQDVRKALRPLAALANRTGCAVILVRHLNKRQDANALYRGGGSIGITAVARFDLLVAVDPDDPDCRVLAVTKGNIGKHPSSLRFRLVPVPGTNVARVEYLGESSHSAANLLQPLEVSSGPGAQARAWLSETLAAGPVEANEVFSQAAQAGIFKITLRRAADAVGVIKQKVGNDGPWEWSMPDVAEGGDVDRLEVIEPIIPHETTDEAFVDDELW